MEVNDISTFLKYWSKIKYRTSRIISIIPEDKLNWSYSQGKFSCAEIVRHIAAIERYLFIETIVSGQNKYEGCHVTTNEFNLNCSDYYKIMHEESYDLLRSFDNDILLSKVTTPNHQTTLVSNWLRAMIEHEIHHRAQLYLYLNILGVSTHPIFELSSEEVISLNYKNDKL